MKRIDVLYFVLCFSMRSLPFLRRWDFGMVPRA
ncbi:hypothetical protein EDC14_10545 [Hydrogenispora ethanolica]|jgi:hypothetical protein|uniref:Uncharacterized protein n=1 Tax=Hydrogenispora ethanolica TaxID=1082276 RepID=A0A4V2QBC4_HYDET|nr:hypothetical protein EDC14_10545 [Hydrogenispora ethanolica]